MPLPPAPQFLAPTLLATNVYTILEMQQYCNLARWLESKLIHFGIGCRISWWKCSDFPTYVLTHDFNLTYLVEIHTEYFLVEKFILNCNINLRITPPPPPPKKHKNVKSIFFPCKLEESHVVNCEHMEGFCAASYVVHIIYRGCLSSADGVAR